MQSILGDGLLAVARLCDQLHVCLSFEEGRDALAQKRMIINRHDPD